MSIAGYIEAEDRKSAILILDICVWETWERSKAQQSKSQPLQSIMVVLLELLSCDLHWCELMFKSYVLHDCEKYLNSTVIFGARLFDNTNTNFWC